jgi:hypothetical protein
MYPLCVQTLNSYKSLSAFSAARIRRYLEDALGLEQMRRIAGWKRSPARFKHFTSGLEQALHPQCEAHIPRDAKFATHEGDLPIQFARQHVQVILRRH